MRKVWEQEFTVPEVSNFVVTHPQPTGKWVGPYLFHGWGQMPGGGMGAILEDQKTGLCHMAPVGIIRFEDYVAEEK